MDYRNKKLQIKQIDEQFSLLNSKAVDVPEAGWIKTIRKAISMSTSQLAAKLGISHQALSNLEKRESDGTITLGKLKEVGAALGLKLFYGFTSEDSLEKMIEKKAKELAIQIVTRTSKQMAMEDQKIRDSKLKEAIEERTKEIIRTMPKNLWD